MLPHASSAAEPVAEPGDATGPSPDGLPADLPVGAPVDLPVGAPVDLPVGSPVGLHAAAGAVSSGTLTFAHREGYPAYFARIAQGPDARAALRRLMPHLDADLDGAERLALWQALWRLRQRASSAAFDQVANCLDGRHRASLQALSRPWDDPALVVHLGSCTRPAVAQAAFVPALLAHHAMDPVSHPDRYPPALVLLAATAALHRATPRRSAEAMAQLQMATLSATEREPSLLPQGLAVLFDLALHAGDADTATTALAELLRHGRADVLPAARVCAWLDGTAFVDDPLQARPLVLAPALQRRWLRPATWTQAPLLLALHDALQRPATRLRLAQLADQMGAACTTPHNRAADTVPARALKALQALDAAHARADRGEDPVRGLDAWLNTDTLAPGTLAALHQVSAEQQAARGDVEGQALALCRSRRRAGNPAVRSALAALLPAPAPAFGPDWREEEPYWQALLQHEDSRWQRLAAFQLATLWTDGMLEPRPPRRCQRLTEAHALWTRLQAEPRYAALAQDALQQQAQTLLRPALRTHDGTAYLWFDSPGAQRVTVVFSCVATHHTFADVATLRGRLPGEHLLFVRCPDKNWYSDQAYDAIHQLLADLVHSRFATTDVTCWYGSMGGHGALKFALAFGWRAIVFNPQTDLDLWAAFRSPERALLWSAERHAELGDGNPQAWERSPLYVACGSGTADREALSWMIERLRQCRHLTAIIEKFDDDNHAGLMHRIADGAVAPVLARITQRLQVLEHASPAEGAQRLARGVDVAFWRELDAACVAKVEVQVRDGRLWWQPSRRTGTQP
jgi:hypothetical protein